MNDIIKYNIPEVYNKILDPIGKAVLNRLFPDDFELYLVAIEVRDDDDMLQPIKELLVFPVNPDSIMLIQRKIIDIRKTFQGIHVNDVDTFVPIPLNISGTFGRKFRILFSGSENPTNALNFKTGFGTTKVLKNIVDMSKMRNESGKPYRTIFYCLPFGGNEVYTVEINECRFSQSMQNNMMWNYDLNMTAVAPGNIGSFTNLTYGMNSLVTIGSLQKIINNTVDIGKNILANVL